MLNLHGQLVAAMAAGLLVVSTAAWAQKGPQGPYANVIANADCTVANDSVLVVALLKQKEKEGVDTYEVGNVTFFLEEKSPNSPKFQEIPGSRKDAAPFSAELDAVPPDERVEVSSHTYTAICSTSDTGLPIPVSADANAVRAVVEIPVLNANPDRRGGIIHTGRCVSFPNPCRLQ